MAYSQISSKFVPREINPLYGIPLCNTNRMHYGYFYLIIAQKCWFNYTIFCIKLYMLFQWDYKFLLKDRRLKILKAISTAIW